MERGDIIISFAGKEVETPNELQRIVAATPPNKKVKVKVIRNGKPETLTVKVGIMPEEITEKETAITTDLGLTVQTLTPDLAEQFNWSRDEKGVLITGVDPTGAGAEAGLRRGDLIKEIDRQEIETTADYTRILEKTKKGESVLFLIKRGTRTFYITLTPEPE
jgi:serine protease Do